MAGFATMGTMPICTIQSQPVCTDELILVPAITYVEGNPNYRKPQSVQVATGQAAKILFTMRDVASGNPVNIQPCLGSGGSVQCRIREATVGMEACQPGITISCTAVTDGSDGRVYCQLTSDVVPLPGIFRAEFGLLDSLGNLIFSDEMWIIVNRGQFALTTTNHGPPTIAEIRLHLRDSDPVDNLWLRVQEFDLSELIACTVRPINYFNEAPPPLAMRYSTSTFPGRYHYLEAIIACLYQMASLHYARTHLPYQQAHGLVVDDKNKAEIYAALGKERWEAWKDWVRHVKIQANAAASIQSIGSPYYSNIWGVDGFTANNIFLNQ